MGFLGLGKAQAKAHFFFVVTFLISNIITPLLVIILHHGTSTSYFMFQMWTTIIYIYIYRERARERERERNVHKFINVLCTGCMLTIVRVQSSYLILIIFYLTNLSLTSHFNSLYHQRSNTNSWLSSTLKRGMDRAAWIKASGGNLCVSRVAMCSLGLVVWFGYEILLEVILWCCQCLLVVSIQGLCFYLYIYIYILFFLTDDMFYLNIFTVVGQIEWDKCFMTFKVEKLSPSQIPLKKKKS